MDITFGTWGGEGVSGGGLTGGAVHQSVFLARVLRDAALHVVGLLPL